MLQLVRQPWGQAYSLLSDLGVSPADMEKGLNAEAVAAFRRRRDDWTRARAAARAKTEA